jgi:hypothetical protein
MSQNQELKTFELPLFGPASMKYKINDGEIYICGYWEINNFVCIGNERIFPFPPPKIGNQVEVDGETWTVAMIEPFCLPASEIKSPFANPNSIGISYTTWYGFSITFS